MGSTESGSAGTTLQTVIFKRLTKQNVDCACDDEKTLNVALEIADEIKNSASYTSLKNMDWILKDTSNFTSNFEKLVKTVLGKLPEQKLLLEDEKLKCFRTLTVLVYAADLYRALENCELQHIVQKTVTTLQADWTLLTRLKRSERKNMRILKIGTLCLTITAFMLWMKYAL